MGKSSKRNVICKEAEVGLSAKFRWNSRRKFDVDEPGMLHVITTKNKQVHFVCGGGVEMVDIWQFQGFVFRVAVSSIMSYLTSKKLANTILSPFLDDKTHKAKDFYDKNQLFKFPSVAYSPLSN
ncbi:hypothetical protein VNO77_44164 [Canavalia gladiata]|uniref:Uncharacterized protein n=1 Tax=Canavalia gladiata TaxID=3824 RepID=A0AAN9JXR7_CANGL